MDMTVEVPELPELTFDEASHIYRLNGDIIPSVSKLMEPLKDQCYGGISKRTLENAAIKGSAVHNSIENWIKFGIDDIPSEHRGYFNGFMEWWKQYKPRVFGSEVRIYHKLADDDLLLLSIGGTLYFIADIGLRMLSPRELYNAMGFPPDYIIDRDYMGNPYPKNEQVARCGNAVCPPMAAAVARANFPEYVAKVGDTITTMAALLDMVAV